MGASRRQLGWESRPLRGIHCVGVRHDGQIECYLVVSQYRSTAFIRTILPLLLVPFYRFYSYRSTAFTRTVLPLLLVLFYRFYSYRSAVFTRYLYSQLLLVTTLALSFAR